MSSHPYTAIHTAVLQAQIEAALIPEGPVVTTLRAAFPQVLAIYAFGSRVSGVPSPDSDLDLALLVAGYAEPLRLWELSGQLASTLGCAVDVLDLRAASTVMQYQVINQGRRLWAKGISPGLFECFVLSEKMAFDAARAGLLSDVAREGRVYGG